MNIHTVGGVVKRVLLNSAPFLLLSAAIYLFCLWGAEGFVEGNIIYKVLTASPQISEGDDSLLVLDEVEKEKLEKNNEGDIFVVPPEFPAIALGEQWATITIESAEVWEVPVFHGTKEESILWKGIGHYSNSRFPGQNGKVVLSGHVGISEFFQRLETMSVGDRVKLSTIYGEYEYEVTETAIFAEDDPTLLLPDFDDKRDRLICYTCYPFHTTSVRTQRFAIICDKVSGKDWTVPVSSLNEEAVK